MHFTLALPAKVRVLNPTGRTALCTLWTPPEYVLKQLGDVLCGKTGPLAVAGGLFGGGLRVLLRNLLYNPQIETLLLYGKDHSGAGRLLRSFFNGGYRRTGTKQIYAFEDGRREELEKAVISDGDLKYVTDGLLPPELFRFPPRVVEFPFDRYGGLAELAAFLSTHIPTRLTATEADRLFVPLPVPETSSFPGETGGREIVADTVAQAWDKLLYRLARFGVPVSFQKATNPDAPTKKRNELRNVKVIVRFPERDPDGLRQGLNLPEEEFTAYAATLLNPELGDNTYTYGNRLRRHFGADLVESVIAQLREGVDARRGYAALWDNTRDMTGSGAPCLVSLFFRLVDGILHLTAVFRAHNAVRAWPLNCVALTHLLRFVCEQIGNAGTMRPAPGTLTVISHSVSINPEEFADVKERVDAYADGVPEMELDPCGYIRLSLSPEEEEIVARLYSHEHELLEEFRGKTPDEVARQLCRKEALSDLGHAVYIGGQLERAWFCLKNGREYVQDKTIIRI